MSGFDAKAFLRSVPSRPGVYQMFAVDDTLLYVGKAVDLKKRLSSYFHRSQSAVKTLAMVSQIARIELTITQTENEALLMENALIKTGLPRFNVLFRDDKSYPYIYISTADEYPRLTFYRGKSKHRRGEYFGPYPSVAAARMALTVMQKAFLIRQCEDSFFRNRSRPCLQYQIKRCAAPCVKAISVTDYQGLIQQAKRFLQGKSSAVLAECQQAMQTAAAARDYETAAMLRDRIAQLRQVQTAQSIYSDAKDTDIAVVALAQGVYCIDMMMVRAGRLLGHKAYFPKVRLEDSPQNVLAAFLAQYYLNNVQVHPLPMQIIVSHVLASQTCLEQTLGAQAGRQVVITAQPRGLRARWRDMALVNAEQALALHCQQNTQMNERFKVLAAALDCATVPTRLECFDVSHTGGELTVASCVIFDSNGPRPADYRRFNISGITPGDDYAALKNALMRRYTRLKKGEGLLPDILFIDGGKGQMAVAREVLQECQCLGVLLVGVAKGPQRKAGHETLWVNGQATPLMLSATSPAHHLIEHIRDEAHRFAITGHRARRLKGQTQSVLEGVPGVGEKRRKALLHHFGGLKAAKSAAVDDLAKVPGISRALAQAIFAALHGES